MTTEGAVDSLLENNNTESQKTEELLNQVKTLELNQENSTAPQLDQDVQENGTAPELDQDVQENGTAPELDQDVQGKSAAQELNQDVQEKSAAPELNQDVQEKSAAQELNQDVQEKSAAPELNKEKSAAQESDATEGKRVDEVHPPDVVVPADNFCTWRKEAVKLRVEEEETDKPISVVTLLKNTADKYPDLDALAVKREGKWVKWTYKQYYEDVRTAAKGFLKLGLEPLGGIGILGFNSPEWFLSELGSVFAGGLSVGIYATNNPEACHYVLENSDANIVVVEDDKQLQKILQVRDRLPELKAIVQWDGQLKEEYPDCYTWNQLMEMGRQAEDDDLNSRISNIAPNKPATVLYTSGTTGNPKGGMLSHDNLTWTALQGVEAMRFQPKEVFLSYMPLSHAAARMMDIYLSISAPSSVYFAAPDALKGSLLATLKEVRPTAFFGVPRVWEKMAEKMKEAGRSASGLKKKIGDWAKDIGYRGNISKMKGETEPFGWTLANVLVFKKVKAALGLDRARLYITAGAPPTPETHSYFLSLDMPLMEVYGLTEVSGPHCVSTPWRFRVNSVGWTFHRTASKINEPDEDGNGEVCMKGRNVMMGYLKMAEQTKEAVDEDGWFHSGDTGRIDEDGFLFVTGRIKELIITSGGENIAPVPIEDVVKEELPVVSNCILIGDKRKFLSMLITLKTEVDAETAEPLDKLTPLAIDWCKALGSEATTVSEIVQSQDELVLKAIQQGIDRANERAVSRAQNIQKWAILPKDFSIPGGELGPTLKLRRQIVPNMYIATIDAFYQG